MHLKQQLLTKKVQDWNVFAVFTYRKMKIRNLKVMLAALLTAMCVTFYSCTNDCFVQTVDEEKAIPTEFTPEECHYMVTMQKGNSVDPNEAMDKVFEYAGTMMTRGENDLEKAGIIYKEEIGATAKDTLLPDTLAYMFESKSQRKRYIVSADNRTNESLLAVYNNPSEEENLSYVKVIIHDIIRKSLANYVKHEIVSYEENKDSIFKLIQSKIAFSSPDTTTYVTRQQAPKGYGLDDEYFVNDYPVGNWYVAGFRDTMVPVSWHQGYPYYYSVDDKANCTIVRPGCVAIAVAQLLTYWENPLYLNGQLVDWDLVTASPTVNNMFSDQGVLVLSLIRDVADGCQTIYTCNGGISDIDKAKSFLENIGFTTDNKQSYSSSSVLQSLVDSRPVLIEGYNNEEIGHEWIIDGFCKNAQLRREELSVYDTQLRRWVVIHTTIVR